MPQTLNKINQPSDLRNLSLSELKELAQEIREKLISTVTANGGHLASNLGVVELTIALHRVFQSPQDKIIWDVGHQSYVHKLLTGRRDLFSTIRTYGGLSGFPDPSESPHDAFAVGHASTSISAALGMAKARDLSGESYEVVAVIGDGALTGGMALEALNNAGQLGTKLIVVFNDNGMSISPSVGALSKLLSRIRMDYKYHRFKKDLKRVLRNLPLSSYMKGVEQRFEGSVKSFISPRAIWEEFGLTYLGPFDGHNLSELEETLTYAKNNFTKPIFFHVITQKGKGYPPAEEDAIAFHGISSKVKKTNSSAPSYSKVFGSTVHRLFLENPKVVAITAAMLEGTGLDEVAKEFPDRVFDVGICEQHAVTFAAGMATRGFTPIVAIYSTFLQRAFDQIIHDVCIQKLPVVFALDRAGIVGDDGKTHQGTFDLSYLSLIPNLVVASPKDENELQHFLYTAINANRPVALRYPRGKGVGVPLESEFQKLPIGKGEVLREGSDLTLLAIGSMVYPSLEAAEKLARDGIEATVINSRFVAPLDSELILKSALRTKGIVTVEENVLAGGFGSSVLELLSEAGLTDVRTKCLGLPSKFIEHGSQQLLRSNYRLDGEGIAQEVENFLERDSLPNLESVGALR